MSSYTPEQREAQKQAAFQAHRDLKAQAESEGKQLHGHTTVKIDHETGTLTAKADTAPKGYRGKSASKAIEKGAVIQQGRGDPMRIAKDEPSPQPEQKPPIGTVIERTGRGTVIVQGPRGREEKNERLYPSATGTEVRKTPVTASSPDQTAAAIRAAESQLVAEGRKVVGASFTGTQGEVRSVDAAFFERSQSQYTPSDPRSKQNKAATKAATFVGIETEIAGADKPAPGTVEYYKAQVQASEKPKTASFEVVTEPGIAGFDPFKGAEWQLDEKTGQYTIKPTKQPEVGFEAKGRVEITQQGDEMTAFYHPTSEEALKIYGSSLVYTIDPQALSKVKYEAFQEQSKQGGVITTGALNYAAAELLMGKYKEGVPVVDEKGRDKAINEIYSSFKAYHKEKQDIVSENRKLGYATSFREPTTAEVESGAFTEDSEVIEMKPIPGQTQFMITEYPTLKYPTAGTKISVSETDKAGKVTFLNPFGGPVPRGLGYTGGKTSLAGLATGDLEIGQRFSERIHSYADIATGQEHYTSEGAILGKARGLPSAEEAKLGRRYQQKTGPTTKDYLTASYHVQKDPVGFGEEVAAEAAVALGTLGLGLVAKPAYTALKTTAAVVRGDGTVILTITKPYRGAAKIAGGVIPSEEAGQYGRLRSGVSPRYEEFKLTTTNFMRNLNRPGGLHRTITGAKGYFSGAGVKTEFIPSSKTFKISRSEIADPSMVEPKPSTAAPSKPPAKMTEAQKIEAGLAKDTRKAPLTGESIRETITTSKFKKPIHVVVKEAKSPAERLAEQQAARAAAARQEYASFTGKQTPAEVAAKSTPTEPKVYPGQTPGKKVPRSGKTAEIEKELEKDFLEGGSTPLFEGEGTFIRTGAVEIKYTKPKIAKAPFEVGKLEPFAEAAAGKGRKITLRNPFAQPLSSRSPYGPPGKAKIIQLRGLPSAAKKRFEGRQTAQERKARQEKRKDKKTAQEIASEVDKDKIELKDIAPGKQSAIQTSQPAAAPILKAQEQTVDSMLMAVASTTTLQAERELVSTGIEKEREKERPQTEREKVDDRITQTRANLRNEKDARRKQIIMQDLRTLENQKAVIVSTGRIPIIGRTDREEKGRTKPFLTPENQSGLTFKVIKKAPGVIRDPSAGSGAALGLYGATGADQVKARRQKIESETQYLRYPPGYEKDTKTKQGEYDITALKIVDSLQPKMDPAGPLRMKMKDFFKPDTVKDSKSRDASLTGNKPAIMSDVFISTTQKTGLQTGQKSSTKTTQSTATSHVTTHATPWTTKFRAPAPPAIFGRLPGLGLNFKIGGKDGPTAVKEHAVYNPAFKVLSIGTKEQDEAVRSKLLGRLVGGSKKKDDLKFNMKLGKLSGSKQTGLEKLYGLGGKKKKGKKSK